MPNNEPTFPLTQNDYHVLATSLLIGNNVPLKSLVSAKTIAFTFHTTLSANRQGPGRRGTFCLYTHLS